MDKQEHILKPKQRVKLKDGYDDMYQVARSGAEGTVVAVQHDPYGYPCALIKWDTDHWTYDGEADGWAFQSHFEPVKEPMTEPEVDPKLVKAIVAALQTIKGNEQTTNTAVDDEQESARRYAEASQVAVDSMNGAQAFLLVAVQTAYEDGIPVLEPQVVTYSSTSEAMLAIEAQISVLNSISHEGLIADKLEQVMQKKDQ